MCGILGVIAKNEGVPVQENLRIIREAIAHRGPDGYGDHLQGANAFANVRLAIVDIIGGKQPMYSDDGKVGIVYNGEVYNFDALRKELEGKGFVFRTQSDTEVILRAYEAYGTESFSRFDGMFGFCLWDDRINAVYIVRDPVGIKPVYVYEDPERIIFSSELKGVLRIPNLDLSLDARGFGDYLTFRYVQAPYTFFKNIRRLEAGGYLEIKDERTVFYRYADVSYDEPYPVLSEPEAKKRLIEILDRSVTSQMMGEVPVGVLLSGGVDSSTIAYFIHKNGFNLKTFNIGFEDINEFEYSRAVAKHLGLEHMEILMTLDDVVNRFDAVMRAIDEPIADPACIPLYFLTEELKKHVTVVLSGEGGDEMFGGYNQYKTMVGAKRPPKHPFRRFLEESYYFNDAGRFLRKRDALSVIWRHKKYFDEQPLLNGMLAYDMKTWMPENLMMKADKILMAHSLEGRFPFLSKEVLDFASRDIPQKYKIRSGVTKWILKEAVRDFLPEGIIERRKMGFSVPVKEILNRMKDTVLSAYDDARGTVLDGVVSVRALRKHTDDYYAGKHTDSLKVWTHFVLVYWFSRVFPTYAESEGNKFCFRQRIADAERKMDVRSELSVKYLSGKGIEVGAWYSPLGVSKDVKVLYVDLIDENEHKRRNPEVKFEFSKIDIIDDGEKLMKINDGSQDFVIANHFLEHTSNILGTIRIHLSKVKKGGILYYAIPNKDFTFDKEREITSFEHLVDDDLHPSDERDFEHYMDWSRKVEGIKNEESVLSHAQELRKLDHRIHFHVWDADALEIFFVKARRYLGKTFDILSFVEVDNEVIVILRKK